jgi:hypothetical protein
MNSGLVPSSVLCIRISRFESWVGDYYCIGKAIPLQALTGSEGSRRLRLPDFKTIGTWRWQGCQPYAPAAYTPRKHSWYSFLLEAAETIMTDKILFPHGAAGRSGTGSHHWWGFTITLRYITFGRPPLDEWSARLRDLSILQHTTLTRDRNACPWRDSNTQSQQASDRIFKS